MSTLENKKSIGLVMAKAPVYSETFLNSKIKNLMDDGFDVYVFTHSSEREKVFFRQVPAHPLPGNFLLRLIYFKYILILLLIKKPATLYRFIRLEMADGSGIGKIIKNIYSSAHILQHHVTHLHFEFSSLSIGLEMSASAIGARMSSSFRGFDISIFPVGKKDIYRRLWKMADVFHTISDDLVIEARKHGLPENAKMVKIFPALDVQKFEYTSHRYTGGILKIFSTGRLHWKKGYRFAIQAIVYLKAKGMEVELTIAGEGEERQELEFLIQQMDLSENVKLLGKVAHEKVLHYLKDAHIYIQPSIQEGFCNSVIEAQAVGLPCVVSDAEGLPENVGEFGWVIGKRDPIALAEAIIEISTLPEFELSDRVIAARQRVEELFQIKKQRDAFKTFFA